MSTIECELFIYEIKKCGLYEKTSEPAKHLDIGSLFKDIKLWAIDSDKPIIETSTFNANTNFHEAYCLGLAEHKGQYLIALWNKVTNSSSGIGVINGSKPAKKTKVTYSKVNIDDIAGYPSFFWILPATNKLVAIRLENPVIGVSQFRAYIKGYLEGFCSHKIKNDNNDIDGYSDISIHENTSNTDDRIVNTNLKPHFSFSAKKIKGQYDLIIQNYSKIIKLVKDVYIYNSLSDNNASWIENIRSFFNDLKPAVKKVVRIQMPISMNQDEVEELITQYEDSSCSEEKDVGFIFSGNSSIKWLSGGHKKEKIQINVNWISEEQPDIDDLLKKLTKHSNLV